MELIPALDLLGGRVVRLVQGDYSQVTDYGDDPIAVACGWVDLGATRLHLVDLDGARAGRPIQAALIGRIMSQVRVPCQVAGGIRDAAAVAAGLAMGADRVVLGSALIRDPGLAEALVVRHGPERIMAAIDVRDGRAVGDGWVPGTAGRPALVVAHELADAGVEWFAVTSIERDGGLGGPDLPLLDEVVATLPGARVIASGGVRSMDDLKALRERGVAAVILGRALYSGGIDLAKALIAIQPHTD